jgi:hypothetical protein
VFAIFLGWLRRTTGSVWAGSVAHAANNGIEDNLNRLTLTGSLSGTVTTSAAVTSLTAEAVLLLGIVATHRLSAGRRAASGRPGTIARPTDDDHMSSLYARNSAI